MAPPKIPASYQSIIDAPWSLENLEIDYVQRREQLADGEMSVSVLASNHLQKGIKHYVYEHLAAFVERPAPDLDRTANLRFHNAFACMVLQVTAKRMSVGMEPPPHSWVQPLIELALVDRAIERYRVLPFIASNTYPIENRQAWLRAVITSTALSGDNAYVQQILTVPALRTAIVLDLLISAERGRTDLWHTFDTIFGEVKTDLNVDSAIEIYAPSIAPHWGVITSLGLTLPEACDLVLTQPDEAEHLPDLKVKQYPH